jgi:hypothetical protein
MRDTNDCHRALHHALPLQRCIRVGSSATKTPYQSINQSINQSCGEGKVIHPREHPNHTSRIDINITVASRAWLVERKMIPSFVARLRCGSPASLIVGIDPHACMHAWYVPCAPLLAHSLTSAQRGRESPRCEQKKVRMLYQRARIIKHNPIL